MFCKSQIVLSYESNVRATWWVPFFEPILQKWVGRILFRYFIFDFYASILYSAPHPRKPALIFWNTRILQRNFVLHWVTEGVNTYSTYFTFIFKSYLFLLLFILYVQDTTSFQRMKLFVSC